MGDVPAGLTRRRHPARQATESQQEEAPRGASGVVLVHGSMHGSWCWESVLRGLGHRGVPAVAVDLPGRGGNATRPAGLRQSIAVIDEAIDRLGGPPLLCAHSAGGIPATYVAAGRGDIHHMVYVAALLPHAPDVAQEVMATTGRHVTVDERGLRIESEAVATELFYCDCAPDLARWAFERLVAEPIPGPDAEAGLPDPTTVRVPSSVPTTYVICHRDQVLAPSLQARLATTARHAVHWPTAHSPFLSQPELVVELLSRLAA